MKKEKLLLTKVYTVSKKHDAPRLWLQNLICETAGFIPGSELYVHVDESSQRITIQNKGFEENQNVHKISVSSRLNRTSKERRPLVDTCGTKYASILCVQEKIEVSVYRQGEHSQVVVRPLHYRLFESETIESPSDERIRLLTICSGSGLGTSMFVDTQYYTAVQEVEIEDDSAEVIKYNFPHSYLFNGDLRDCGTVAKADVAFCTLDCSEHTSLGDGGQGYFNNLVLGTYKILKAAEPSVIFFENVPSFYQSRSYLDLKELLSPIYPYFIGPIQIDSYDFGSIARRDRSYVVCMREREDFEHFRTPKAPTFRRFKLKEFLDPKGTEHVWKSVSSWRESFASKVEKNNSWAERSTEKTFVNPNTCTELQCIPRRYRSHSASNSYVLNDEGTEWRFLTISELRRIFHIPSWFQFPKHTPVSRIYEMIGQSLCGKIIKCFANEIATMFFRRHAGVKTICRQEIGLMRDSVGQIGFSF
ncbi:MAG: DNA cytosine methyltransferase [Candidatus Pristimantibacillus sp.]